MRSYPADEWIIPTVRRRRNCLDHRHRAGAASRPPPVAGASTFRIAPGDRVGLVGRNGAGKTTLTRCLSGEAQPATGEVTKSGNVGYLPQDPRTGDLHVLAHDRILSARGLDRVLREMRDATGEMASADTETHERAMRRYAR